MSLAAAFATSLLVGLAMQPLVIRWLRRRGVMDTPNARSSHATVTPRGGGVAVGVALGLGIVAGQANDSENCIVLVGCLILGAVGFVDDVRGLSAKVRLGLVIAVGAIAGLTVDSPLPLILTVPLMAVWVGALVNAFNFMDGINGISGLTGLVSGVAYAVMGLQFDSSALAVAGAALAGASLSLLPFNFPRAKVFLGDVGSYLMGFAIAALAWMAWAAGSPLALAIAPTAVYLADTGSTLVRRHRQGQPLMVAHREHAYQRLATRAGSHTRVALLVAGIETATVAAVWLGYAADQGWLHVVAVVLVTAMLAQYLRAGSTEGAIAA